MYFVISKMNNACWSLPNPHFEPAPKMQKSSTHFDHDTFVICVGFLFHENEVDCYTHLLEHIQTPQTFEEFKEQYENLKASNASEFQIANSIYTSMSGEIKIENFQHFVDEGETEEDETNGELDMEAHFKHFLDSVFNK